MKSTKIVEAARELLKSFGYFVDNLWHVEDVHFICEQHELPKLSDEEAMEVFIMANEQFDGETGLSWPHIEKALHQFLRHKELLANMCISLPVESLTGN